MQSWKRTRASKCYKTDFICRSITAYFAHLFLRFWLILSRLFEGVSITTRSSCAGAKSLSEPDHSEFSQGAVEMSRTAELPEKCCSFHGELSRPEALPVFLAEECRKGRNMSAGCRLDNFLHNAIVCISTTPRIPSRHDVSFFVVLFTCTRVCDEISGTPFHKFVPQKYL
jgi:hypothetical protein